MSARIGERRPADLALLAGAVHTLDPGAAPATALAVRDGRLVAVGDAGDVRPWIGRRTRVLDAPDAVVTPGLVDSHQHPVMGLAQCRGVDLSSATDVAGLRGLLRAEHERLSPDEWLVGYGLDYGVFAGQRLHADLVDDVAAGRPTWLWLFDLHTALLSREALRRAGIDGPLAFADRGEVVLGSDGRPTGELREMSAIARAHRALPTPGVAELARRLQDLFAEHNRRGLTGVHVLDLWPGTERLLDLLEDEDRLSLRVKVAPWVRAEDVGDSIADAAALHERRQGRRTLWTAGALKLFLDGTVDGGTAWLSHPDCHGQSTQAQWLEPEQYAAAVHKAVGSGLSCWTHAIGDAAVGCALDAYQQAGRPSGGRHRVEHVEVLADRDVVRFAELDVVASMQPTHMDWSEPDHSDNWSRRLGPERCAAAWRYRDLLEAGATLAFGSDWPIADADPRVVMAGARLRRPAGRPDRAPYEARQALTAWDALSAMTRGPARAAGEEAVAGVVRVGRRADLTVFAGDPLTCSPDDLPDLPVLATVVDGRPVHLASGLG